MHRSGRPLVATLALALLGLASVALPLWRGGVDWTAQSGALVVSGAAFFLASYAHRGAVPNVAAALAVVFAGIALQLVPVPPLLHRALSPGAADAFGVALSPLGLYPATRPLSLEPPQTARELAKAAACLLALSAAGSLAFHSRRTRDRLLAFVALSGVVAAGAGLVAAMAGFAPALESRLTFVNPNHLSGFLNLTSFVALGFALRSHARERFLWLVAFAISGSGVFLTLSRGGVAAFFVGAAVFSVLHLRRLRLEEERPGPWRHAAAPGAIAVALAAAAYLALGPVLMQMQTVAGASHEAKLAMWPVALRMLGRFALLGIGRGAYPTAFTSFKVDPDPLTFTHVENEWLQLPIDLGVPLGLLLIGAVVWIWLKAARSRELSRVEIGALAGTAALAAHNTVDFSLELLGVAIPAAITLGALARRQRPALVREPHVRLATAIVVALGALGMGIFLAHRPERDVERVTRAMSASDAARLAREAALWHPVDYLPQAIAGARLVEEGRCAEGLHWLERAMLLNPTAAEPHRFTARCLAGSGKDTLARREYRLASLLGDKAALGEAAERYTRLEDLLEIVPDTPEGLTSLARLLSGRRPSDARQLLRRAWDEYQDLEALRGLAWSALDGGDPEEALRLSRVYEDRRPFDAQVYGIAARALERLGRPSEAREALERGLARVPGSPPLLNVLAEQALARRLYAESRRLAESIAPRTPAEAAARTLFVSRILWAQGRMREAIQEARVARDTVPADASPRVVLAEYCAGAERFEEAIEALEGAAALPSSTPGAYDARLAQLRAARRAQIERRNRDQFLDGAGATAPASR